MQLIASLRSHTIGVLMVGLYSIAAAAEPAAPVIELPRFVVTELRELPPPESWRYAEIPGLEILSQASEAHTRRFARNFLRLQQVTEIVWPAITRGAPPLPAVLVLCDGGSAFESFRPTKPGPESIETTSLLLHENERTAIVVDVVREKSDVRLSAAGAAVEPASTDAEVAGSGGFMTENDPYREFYLQYFRLTIRRGAGTVAPWLEEGLVQLLASIDFSKDYIAIGRLRDGAGGQRADEFNLQLSHRPLLPLEEMFARERPGSAAASAYSAQCYAFVHLCLYGKKARHRPALLKLVERAASAPVTEPTFKECFGLSFEQMATELRAYVSFTAHEYVEFRADKGSPGLEEPPALRLHEATQAEIGRIKGETFQLGGHADRARTALIAPYVRNEYDPRLLAALGLDERRRGQDERARKLFEAAARDRAHYPRAYLELARIRFAGARTGAAANAPLSREQAISILQPLLTATRQSPPLPEVYELIAEVWAISARAPSPEELAVLYEGAQRFPRRLRLVYLTAALALRHGTADTARALIVHGLKIAGDSEVSQHFKALKAQLPD
ncbi:MAG: hypothetical protein EXS37_05250 [Opitutus sp.]|nr:hypothetical protein [Opitutus sp.]